MIYCFDLDGTLVTEHMTKGTDSDYHLAEPIPTAIKKVQKLWDEGNEIIIMTGRGVRSGSTIPVFDIITGNASRNAIVMSLGVEDMV